MRTAYDPHGAALLDYFSGNTSATLICRQDGERDDVPAAFWFRQDFDPLEVAGLEECRGHVLDVGAGTGVHALALQRRGLRVTAIDVVPACVEIMRARGVHDAVTADIFDLAGGRFDTVLCLCNGLDKVGRLSNLVPFLERLRTLVAPGGLLVADSFDLRVGASPERLAALERNTKRGRYFGELELELEYQGKTGAPFSVLHVDYETFARAAEQTGWSAERLRSKGGHYLARALAV